MTTAPPRRPSAFEAVSVGDAFAVIDKETGHQVSFRTFEDRRAANGLAYALNGALRDGPRALARAMGAHDG